MVFTFDYSKQKMKRKGKKKLFLTKHLSSGDSRMGCTALSPSFHGNLLLWKQALEQTQESGGGDFLAEEAEGGEDRSRQKKWERKEKTWRNGEKVKRKD